MPMSLGNARELDIGNYGPDPGYTSMPTRLPGMDEKDYIGMMMQYLMTPQPTRTEGRSGGVSWSAPGAPSIDPNNLAMADKLLSMQMDMQKRDSMAERERIANQLMRESMGGGEMTLGAGSPSERTPNWKPGATGTVSGGIQGTGGNWTPGQATALGAGGVQPMLPAPRPEPKPVDPAKQAGNVKQLLDLQEKLQERLAYMPEDDPNRKVFEQMLLQTTSKLQADPFFAGGGGAGSGGGGGQTIRMDHRTAQPIG